VHNPKALGSVKPVVHFVLSNPTRASRLPRCRRGSDSLPGMDTGFSVDVEAVRKQLRLLGHTVPDEVIQSFIAGLRVGGDRTDAAGA
jgi:hypothetical protein